MGNAESVNVLFETDYNGKWPVIKLREKGLDAKMTTEGFVLVADITNLEEFKKIMKEIGIEGYYLNPEINTDGKVLSKGEKKGLIEKSPCPFYKDKGKITDEHNHHSQESNKQIKECKRCIEIFNTITNNPISTKI